MSTASVARKRAVAYYRCSTDLQDASIERQRTQVLAHIRRKGYDLLAEEEDEAVRGHVAEGRPGFQRVMQLVRARKVDVVVVDEMSRLSRFDVVDFMVSVVHPFREAGATVDSVADGLMGWEDIASLVMLVIRQDKASGESKTFSRRILTALLKKASEGRFVPSLAPYGYRFEGSGADKRLVLGPDEEVRTVHWIFDAIANKDYSTRRICGELNARAVRPPVGNGRAVRRGNHAWSSSTVKNILHNRRYVGDSPWNSSRQSRHNEVRGGEVVPSEQKGGYRRSDEKDVVLVTGTHPAIIDRALFEKAQATLERKKKDNNPTKQAGKHLFTGLLICGDCGWRLVGGTRRNRRYYRCCRYARMDRRACNCNTVYEDDLYGWVIEALERDFLSAEAVDLLRQELIRQAEALCQSGEEERLLGRVKELDGMIATGRRNLALLPQDLLAGVISQVREWEEERARLVREAKQLREAVQEIESEIEFAQLYLFEMREALACDEEGRLRGVIRQMIQKIELTFRDRPVKATARVGKGLRKPGREVDVIRITPNGLPSTSHLAHLKP